ncbi:MAG: HAMP domain-containing histidine kinase [Chloroflexales bacterium]|nr:HAMP domain-containing histidine kinase [Chloroflexales bacterium]
MITAAIVAAVISVTALSILREQRTFQSELQQQAGLLLDTLASATANRLYYLDQQFLSETMQNLVTDGIIVDGRIYDPHGRVIADAVDPLAGYASSADPLGQRLAQSESPVFEWLPNRLQAGQAVVVGREHLGAISVVLPTDALAAKMAAVRAQGISVALAAACIGMVLSVLFSRSITAPLRELTRAVDRVAEGDLDQQIAVHTRPWLHQTDAAASDEIGSLQRRFNQMVIKLRQSIVQRDAALAQSQEAAALAQQANHSKSEFVSFAAHELKTPMTAIKGYADLLQQGIFGPVAPDHVAALQTILDNVKMMTTLTSDLTDVAQIETNYLRLTCSAVPISDIIAETLRTLQIYRVEQEHTVYVHTSEYMLPVWGDPARLLQILTNLLSNAHKYTPQKGTITIAVNYPAHVLDVDVAAMYMHISIRDTGIGIHPDEQRAIFHKFFRATDPNARAVSGTGLGLHITKHLVEMHNGQIWFESVFREGTTFHVILPVVEAWMAPDTKQMLESTISLLQA